MKKVLLLLFASAAMMAQEQTVTLSMGGGYSDEVYFKFSDESSVTYDREIWDLAFLRTSNYNQGIRLNEGRGLNVYEASSNVEDWDTLDISASEGEALHNSEITWEVGAFNNASGTYGWGEYNPSNHHVTGSVVFLIEDYASSSYYKFMIEDYFGAYTIKYALWNGSGWDEDQTAVISNNENEGQLFNFFDLENGEIVEASPALDGWDIVFKRYSAMVSTNDGTQVPYTVTGVLQNSNVTIAHVEETPGADWDNTNDLTFSEDINTIGYTWKQLNDQWAYEIVENQVYYIKSNDIVYRMYFTNFTGSSSGDLSFVYETEDLSTVDASGNVKFAIYPNPVKNNQITLVYDNAKTLGEKAQVEIYNMTGQKVFETQLNNTTGLYQRDIQLNQLSKGIYILKFIQGNDIQSKKLIVQ